MKRDVRVRWRRKEERDSLKTEFVYVRYRASDIFTVTEPGPLGAAIIHQGDVLAMCQTHTVWNCVYCETDIKDVGGEWRRRGLSEDEERFIFFSFTTKENLSVLILENQTVHVMRITNVLTVKLRESYIKDTRWPKCISRTSWNFNLVFHNDWNKFEIHVISRSSNVGLSYMLRSFDNNCIYSANLFVNTYTCKSIFFLLIINNVCIIWHR